MSRFDAAMNKPAAAKPKAKAAAATPATVAKPVAKAVAASAAPKAAGALNTIDEMKVFTKRHERKIEDAEEAVKDEPNRSAKKVLEVALKKLKDDETYIKCVAAVKEAVFQAAKDAERAAALKKAAVPTKGASKNAADESSSTEVAGPVDVDASVIAEIDAAFSATGKDAAAAKVVAVERMEQIKTATPFVLPRLGHLISLFDNSKLAAPAIKAVCGIIECIQPKGHGVATTVIPALLAGMDDKKWKIKAGCIEALLPALHQMASSTPAQLSQSLPLIVPKLAECALEVRAEIRTATAAVLREIGELVASPEIKKLSQDLVTALAEPTNQKHTQAVLAKMGNQTFLSLIDAASLSLLMPVVIRGLKERDSASKKWSAQIFGSTSMLVKDVETMKPYLKTVGPLLQDALTDPVSEVVREAAKVYGIMEQVLPEYSRNHNQPWLFSKLRNGAVGEQIGASLALAEVFLKINATSAAELLPEIEAGIQDAKGSVRRGFLELMDAMPNAMKMDFVPHLARFFPSTIMGITGDKDKDEDTGLKASLAWVARYGDLCPEFLLPATQSVYAATLHGATASECSRQQIVRERLAMLLGKIVDKILEHKKFGQDLLSTDDCSTKKTREFALVLIFLMRSDADAGVKRFANAAWKAAGGAPKVLKALLPAIEKQLLSMRNGDLGLGAQGLAAKVLSELVSAGELVAPEDEVAVAAPFHFSEPVGRITDSAAASIVAGTFSDKQVDSSAALQGMVCGDAAAVKNALEILPVFADVSSDVRMHFEMIAASVLLEGKKGKKSGPAIVKVLADCFAVAMEKSGAAAVRPLVGEAPAAADVVVRAAMGSSFDAVGAGGGDDSEYLLQIEGLLLMYGAGHLLLKDTTLEMKKNHRYGVVGQNGAGKTTLMKEIADHRIVGMPADIKCVHVDDSKLGLMSKSCLTTLEYCIKMAKDIGVQDIDGRQTLLGVGFAEKTMGEPVSELSTGWRMRLTLAVAMLKHADLVLLDEPTNHLDEESVEWLANYICSIDKASVMVISHEPKFLDKTCTDIMAYVDKKLEYTAGNFTSFAASRGLSKEQIDAMLSGNLSFDTKTKEDGDEESDEAANATTAVAGPPKLRFPIPGTMEGVKSGSKAVLEAKKLSFRYAADKDYLVADANLKLSLNSRVAISGRNGCGKSTLMTLLCSEANASENKDGTVGDVTRHCNLRMAYMKQDHLKALGPFFDTSPFVYITQRFKDGYDGDLQQRLCEPEDDEDAERRKALAKEHGKYGNEVGELLNRTKIGSQLAYEVAWKGLDDPKQNTIEPISKLRLMGLEKVVIAADERIAAKAAGLDQRPLSRREVVAHCEAFGIDEEMCCNRQIRGFSAGQKVRLSLAAMFWTKPHLIAVDEPTNYLDVETVEALAKALNTFRGGIVMIEPKTDFVERICNEKWHLENGVVTIEKLKNGAKRQA